MSIKTLDVRTLRKGTRNIYESMVIIGKRARQIAANEKLELDEKLRYFEGVDDEEEITFNEEQERISKEYERRLHCTRRAIAEFQNDEIYYRTPEQE